MTREEYAAARRDFQLAARPYYSELVKLAVTAGLRIVMLPGGEMESDAVYSAQADEYRRRLLSMIEGLQRSYFPLSFCSGCGRIFVNCQCDE